MATITKEHKHTISVDPETQEQYCSVCGEYVETEPLVQETAIDRKSGEPKGYSTGLGTQTMDIRTKTGKAVHIIEGKQRFFITTMERVEQFGREHDIRLNDDDMRNIHYYVGKFYDYKKAHNIEPHAKDLIIGYFVFLNCVQSGNNYSAAKVLPDNNSKFIEVMREVGISDSRLKELFITYPMICRWLG